MGPQFIFQITDLTKKFGQRELLKDINVAFYPGAKIGLLGTSYPWSYPWRLVGPLGPT